MPVVDALRARFGDAILDAAEAMRGDPSVTVRADKALAAAYALRDEHSFDLMSDATAIDGLNLGHSPRFTAIWNLYDSTHNQKLRLRVPASGGDTPKVPSLTPVWAGANWMEREAFDLLGIRYDGHPDPVSYTHLRAHETVLDLVCRLLLEKTKNTMQ